MYTTIDCGKYCCQILHKSLTFDKSKNQSIISIQIKYYKNGSSEDNYVKYHFSQKSRERSIMELRKLIPDINVSCSDEEIFARLDRYIGKMAILEVSTNEKGYTNGLLYMCPKCCHNYDKCRLYNNYFYY